jgi:hypothetical protein
VPHTDGLNVPAAARCLLFVNPSNSAVNSRMTTRRIRRERSRSACVHPDGLIGPFPVSGIHLHFQLQHCEKSILSGVCHRYVAPRKGRLHKGSRFAHSNVQVVAHAVYKSANCTKPMAVAYTWALCLAQTRSLLFWTPCERNWMTTTATGTFGALATRDTTMPPNSAPKADAYCHETVGSLGGDWVGRLQTEFWYRLC